MRPFLFLATRAEEVAADEEYAAMLRFSGLEPDQLTRFRLERHRLPAVNLDDWSGIILGGSPFNNSDPAETKSATQLRVEADISGLLDEVVPADFPMLGACYGIGSIGTHQGAVIDRTYGEPVSRITVHLTAEGGRDPLFRQLPDSFEAFVGHKEAVRMLPGHLVQLASSAKCPVQAFRVGQNVYATQYHPELDSEGLATRIMTYRHYGYFAPHEAQSLVRMARRAQTPHAPDVLAAFVRRYARG